MAEYRLQETDFPSTFEYHQHRERAAHLEQNWHAGRLFMAAKFIRRVAPHSVVDLGCGDGGLLSLIKDIPSWGYDFCPANAEGWTERGVQGQQLDVFNTDFNGVQWGELTVVTEVLEHLANPHGAVERIAKNSKYIVASCPFDERPEGDHDEHLWGFDEEGFKALVGAHFTILEYRRVDWTQLLLGKSHYA